jgi:ribonuclease M5
MDLLNKRNEVVVVEGYHDLAKLKEVYPTIDVVITNGSEISDETLEELKKLNDQRGLILFLDPDYQGERIRRIINEYVGETKHAFMRKSDCINKNKTKVGIEHADSVKIKEALDKIYVQSNNINNLDIKDLYYYNLIGDKGSKKLRKTVTENLGIGLCNGKTLLKKLNMFNIKKEELENLLRGE